MGYHGPMASRFHAPYMTWAKTRPAARFDLAGSNVLACTLDDLTGAREALSLSGHNDNKMRLWEVETGRLAHTFSGHTEGIWIVAFSPQGHRALSGGAGGKLRLWDSRKGRWTGINPHDRYEMDPGARIEHLPGDILHYSYTTIDDHRKQVDYFTSIAAKAYAKSGKRAGFVKSFLSPLAKFIGDYFFRLGFLDGRAGFTIARISAGATRLKYAKLRDLQNAAR